MCYSDNDEIFSLRYGEDPTLASDTDLQQRWKRYMLHFNSGLGCLGCDVRSRDSIAVVFDWAAPRFTLQGHRGQGHYMPATSAEELTSETFDHLSTQPTVAPKTTTGIAVTSPPSPRGGGPDGQCTSARRRRAP